MSVIDEKTGLTQEQAEILNEGVVLVPEGKDQGYVIPIEEKTQEELDYEYAFHNLLIAKLKLINKVTEEPVVVGANGETGIHYIFDASLTDAEYNQIIEEINGELIPPPIMQQVPGLEVRGTTSKASWSTPVYDYVGALPQLYRATGSLSFPLYDSIFSDTVSATKLGNGESFVMLTGATGTITNRGNYVERHKIVCCSPSGGLVTRYLPKKTIDNAFGTIKPWTWMRYGVVQFIGAWRCTYKVNYSTGGGLPVYSSTKVQMGFRAPHNKLVLAADGASVGSTMRNWLRIVGYEGTTWGSVSGFTACNGDWNANKAWFISTGIESRPSSPFVKGNW